MKQPDAIAADVGQPVVGSVVLRRPAMRRLAGRSGSCWPWPPPPSAPPWRCACRPCAPDRPRPGSAGPRVRACASTGSRRLATRRCRRRGPPRRLRTPRRIRGAPASRHAPRARPWANAWPARSRRPDAPAGGPCRAALRVQFQHARLLVQRGAGLGRARRQRRDVGLRLELRLLSQDQHRPVGGGSPPGSGSSSARRSRRRPAPDIPSRSRHGPGRSGRTGSGCSG